jgi:hypothetical protein
MESDIMQLFGFGAAIALIIVAARQLNYMWLDPRKETDAEKRRREKREKKEASKPKQVEERSRQGAKKTSLGG